MNKLCLALLLNSYSQRLNLNDNGWQKKDIWRRGIVLYRVWHLSQIRHKQMYEYIHLKVFDTNKCLYGYLRFLNSFATRPTANDGWTSSSPKCKMDPTVGQGPSDTDQTGIFSRHWCATICKGSPAQPPPEDTNTFVTYYLGIGAFKQKWWEKTLSLCPNCIIEASLTNKISISRLKRPKESERYKWSCDVGQL